MEIQDFAPEESPERAYALAAATAMERMGCLFQFLDQHLGEVVMFDPDAAVKESVIRDAIKVGLRLCIALEQDGKKAGIDSAILQDRWAEIVEMVLVRFATSTPSP